MEKKFFNSNQLVRIVGIIILICIMAISLIACSNSDSNTAVTPSTNNVEMLYDQFVVIESRTDWNWSGRLYIVYDKDTGVMYYFAPGSHTSGISPIYGNDGNVMIYRGWTPES